MQLGLGTVLHHSITPSLRVAGSEDEDENEAPYEQAPEGAFQASVTEMLQSFH